MDRKYICIDLKSFYASAECVFRGLDPLRTNLVVADNERTEKTICLAVSPSLKALGISSRPRLFEVVEGVKKINRERQKNAPYHRFYGKSYDSIEISNHPEYAVSYIVATPQMGKYIEVSSAIYKIYLRHVAAEDIHVYSIDEVFMDVTSYLKGLNITAVDFARKIVADVLKETGITATAGVGSNLYLAKVAMDIVAKKMAPDENGCRVAELDEMSYRHKLWCHRPFTDFWRVGAGTQRRLEKYGIYTMGDIALTSVGDISNIYNENLLYKEFGVNAELLIDHAWGYENTTIADIKMYTPKSTSLSSGQVLSCGYDFTKTRVVVKEMMELLSLDLVKKSLLTNQISLSIGYDIENLNNNYTGEIVKDYLGRNVPKGSHASINIEYTSSTRILMNAITELYDMIANPNLMIRRINISVNNLVPESSLNDMGGYYQLNLFEDYDEHVKQEEANEKDKEKEKKLQKAILGIKDKYGKNSVLKALNLDDGATTINRNNQIGGHKK